MIPYFALILISTLCSLFSVHTYKKSATKTVITLTRDRNSAALPAFFFMYFLLLALRHEMVGNDTFNYQNMFLSHTQWGGDYIFSSWQEVIFRAFNWGVRQFTDNFRIFLILTSLICVLPIAYIYNQDKTHGLLKIAVFVNMSTFIMLFSGIRQAMAMGVGMLAYKMVKERKLWKFLLLATVAMLIHHSGFMVFFMYPLYYVRFQKIHLLVVVPLIVAVFVFNKQIFGALAHVFEFFSIRYSAEATSTGAYGSLILFVAFSVFSYVITDDTICDSETIGLRNFLLFTVVIQCFAPLYDTAMRMNYYYILFIPLALGKCLDYSKKSMRQVAKTGEIVITVFFLLYFVYTVCREYFSGISTLNTVPYVPFWKNP